jgi:NTP pyrophosphatase (non-canonical NTP hydrolase)
MYYQDGWRAVDQRYDVSLQLQSHGAKNMDFNFYQERAKSFDIGAADVHYSHAVHCMGLAGETGEVMELMKKMYRDGATVEFIQNVKKELGDVLWYIAVLAHDHGLTLEEIASHNIVKLQSRKDRGALGGSGDNR